MEEADQCPQAAAGRAEPEYVPVQADRRQPLKKRRWYKDKGGNEEHQEDGLSQRPGARPGQLWILHSSL